MSLKPHKTHFTYKRSEVHCTQTVALGCDIM